MLVVNKHNFNEHFNRNFMTPRSGHGTDVSRLKDILANKMLKTDCLKYLAHIARVDEVDIKKQKSVDDYVKRAAAVVREMMFDENQEVKPWVRKALRYQGYQGEFDEAAKKDIMNGALFQLVQTSVNVAHSSKFKGPDQTELFKKLLLNVRRSQCEWTGYSDRQTQTKMNDKITAKTMMHFIDQNKEYNELRSLVPEINADFVDSAMLANSKFQIENKFLSTATALSKSIKTQPMKNIAKKAIFPDEAAYHAAILAGVDDVDITDPDEIQEYIARCTQVASKTLLDENNDLKPWVKQLCLKNRYNGDFSQDDIKALIHASVKQMVKVGLKDYYKHAYNSKDTKPIYARGMAIAKQKLEDFFMPNEPDWNIHMVVFHADFTESLYDLDEVVPDPTSPELDKALKTKKFDKLMQSSITIERVTSSESHQSALKSIIANQVLRNEALDKLTRIAKIDQVDLEDDESVTNYIERCAAVTSKFMFTDPPENEVKPWLQDILRASGYQGEFHADMKKHLINVALFQMVQVGLASYYHKDYVKEDPDEHQDSMKHFTERRMDIRRIQSVWTGCPDWQTETKENLLVTADKLLEAVRGGQYDDVISKVPEYDHEQVTVAIRERCRMNFEEKFVDELNQSENLPSQRINPKASVIIDKKILTDNLVTELSNIANVRGIDLKDKNKLNAYADRSLALMSGMLFENHNEVKPWVRDILTSQGYRGDMESPEFKKQLLNEVTCQFLDKSLTAHAKSSSNYQSLKGDLTKGLFKVKQRTCLATGCESSALRVKGMNDWGVDQVLFGLRTDKNASKIMDSAPDPSSDKLTKECARQNLLTIMRHIELDTKSKWTFKKMRSASRITIDGKKYPVPKRLKKAYDLIQKGLENDEDPFKLSEQVEKVIESKTKTDMSGLDKKTREAYSNIHSQLITERENRKDVQQSRVHRRSMRSSMSM